MIVEIIAVATIGAGVMLYLQTRASMISGTEARTLVADGAKLVDVRSVEEFSSGHITGAVNIPLDRLDARHDEIGDKTVAVVVYCHSGMRSARAKRILEAKGFDKVSNLGGIHRWPPA